VPSALAGFIFEQTNLSVGMFAKTEGKPRPASSEAVFQIERATCERPVGAMCLVEVPPFFEIEPPQQLQTASRARRRSSVATNEDVFRWIKAVLIALEKAHKKTANWTRAARYVELQATLTSALPNFAVMAWIMRHPGSPAERLRTFLGDCLTELAEIAKLDAGSENRIRRVSALKSYLATAATAGDRPFETIADPYLGIADILYARSAAVIFTMLVWSEE